MDHDTTWYGGRLQPRPHCVRWGPSSAHLKRGTASPHSLAHVYCAQTAGWIKMPLGTKECLGPGHIVLHGDPASPQKGHSPQFSAHVYCNQTVTHLSYC